MKWSYFTLKNNGLQRHNRYKNKTAESVHLRVYFSGKNWNIRSHTICSKIWLFHIVLSVRKVILFRTYFPPAFNTLKIEFKWHLWKPLWDKWIKVLVFRVFGYLSGCTQTNLNTRCNSLFKKTGREIMIRNIAFFNHKGTSW